MSKTRFEKIKQAYFAKDEAGMKKGILPMRSTDKGFWGVSHIDDVYAFFEKMQFSSDTTFIDLGCGDGRVVLVASLFVQATGIEWDAQLVEQGNAIAKEIGLSCELIQGDMRDVDFSSYDALYMYADQRFAFLEKKLKQELRGTLYLYHDTYHPRFLRKGKITWVGQIPIYSYTNDTISKE